MSESGGRVAGGRWGMGTQILLVVGLTATAWFTRWALSSPSPDWPDVKRWLESEGFGRYSLLFKKAGVTTMTDCADVRVATHPELSRLDSAMQQAVQKASTALRDKLIFEAWLQMHSLEPYTARFQATGIQSLKSLIAAPDTTIQKVMSADYSKKDYGRIRNRLLDLHGYQDMESIETQQWLRILRGYNRSTCMGWATIALTLGIGLMVAYAAMYVVQQRGQIPTSKHSLLEYVTGKYLALQYCKVCWEWEEPQTVGKTVSYKVKFYQRNGRPYPISTGDNLLIEIMHGNSKIPPTVQFGVDVNAISVAFTVHRAGEYKISIMVGARHIRGSPFSKSFLAGPLDPGKSGFVGQSTIVVCTQGLGHQLLLEPRDEYGNLCTYAPENDHRNNYQIQITELESQKSWVPELQVMYEKLTRRIILTITLNHDGCYQANAAYKGVPLKNGQFTILVLNTKDASLVKKAVAKKCHNLYYEARLLSANYNKQDKAKKVFCYISPKQLTVKEFYLKLIPKRLFTFRVCPSTKFQFLGYNNQYESATFRIEDGAQPPVELAAKERNIIAATFTNFLLTNIGGSETFKDKQDFFYHEVRQIHHKRLHDKLTLKVPRAGLLEASLKACKNFSTSDWCRNFEIVFQGEEALDWGGVRREWIELVCCNLFHPEESGLYRRFKDDNQGLVHPNPYRPPHLKMKYYEFAGKIVGKCLYESALGGSYRQLVKARFTRSFLAQLIGLRVNYKYFMQDDPDLFMTKIKYIEDNDMDGMELVFSEEEYKDGQLDRVVDLIPNGSRIPVTNQNKLRYLDALAQYKLANNCKEEIEAFLKGLNELIPDNLLSIFDENELELLMCGTGNYSISEFREHHIIAGTSPEFNKVLEWFWTLVSGFTRDEMGRLLQFTTGCSQLPPGGFAELVPKFQITAAPTYGNLPTAHTCFNQLCLPNYDTMEQFRQALLMALNEGNQGFGMI